MAKPTSYQLLKDTHAIVNRMEDKIDKRITEVEKKVDKNESRIDNMLGKIGLGVIIISASISLIFGTVLAWIKKTFNI